MNKLNDDYYWYDKATDTVIQCNKTQYREFLKKNYDKFNLINGSETDLIYGAKEYGIIFLIHLKGLQTAL